jgi:acyl-CoA reductase-like NAD-dependent aldehyde dehydrogenase
MIAALSGSTPVPAMDVFHALLAGNGRLIAPSTVTFVAAAALVVAFVAAADDEVAA